jgi:hypothetical protein
MKSQELLRASVLEHDLARERVVLVQTNRVRPGFEAVAGELRPRGRPMR